MLTDQWPLSDLFMLSQVNIDEALAMAPPQQRRCPLATCGYYTIEGLPEQYLDKDIELQIRMAHIGSGFPRENVPLLMMEEWMELSRGASPTRLGIHPRVRK